MFHQPVWPQEQRSSNLPENGHSYQIAVHIVIGAQKFMGKSRGQFVCWQSARGLAYSKTLRAFQKSSCRAQRLGLSTLRSTATGDGQWPSAAFPRGVSNCAWVNCLCSGSGRQSAHFSQGERQRQLTSAAPSAFQNLASLALLLIIRPPNAIHP